MRALVEPPGTALLAPALDALSAHVAIVDATGVIVHVNRAWLRFGEQNGLEDPSSCLGVSYLEICDAAEGDGAEAARSLAKGLRRVLSGEAGDFEMEYPCHARDAQRWFVVRVVDARVDPRLALVVHENVTARKLGEGYAAERAVARGVARRLLGAIGTGNVHEPEKRQLGRAIAKDAALTTVAAFLDAFGAMGLGDLALHVGDDGRFTFHGTALVERMKAATAPSCHVTLGYLEGAVAIASGRDALGTETECRSLGHERCTFVVRARARGA